MLLRPGQTPLNAEGRLAGRLDVPLTALGVAQARAAADAVRALGGPGRVVASPLERARATATALEAPVEVDERWIELDYGGYDGWPLAEVPAALWDDWRADPRHAPPGGESLADVGRRVRDACEELRAAGGPGVVTVVSHVSPIKAAVAWALGVGDEVSWRMFLAPASVTVIGLGPRPNLQAFNCTSHLAGVAAP